MDFWWICWSAWHWMASSLTCSILIWGWWILRGPSQGGCKNVSKYGYIVSPPRPGVVVPPPLPSGRNPWLRQMGGYYGYQVLTNWGWSSKYLGWSFKVRQWGINWYPRNLNQWHFIESYRIAFGTYHIAFHFLVTPWVSMLYFFLWFPCFHRFVSYPWVFVSSFRVAEPLFFFGFLGVEMKKKIAHCYYSNEVTLFVNNNRRPRKKKRPVKKNKKIPGPFAHLMPCYGTVGLAWLAHAIVWPEWPVPAARKEFPKEDWQNWQQGRFNSDRFLSPFTRHSLRTTLSPRIVEIKNCLERNLNLGDTVKVSCIYRPMVDWLGKP